MSRLTYWLFSFNAVFRTGRLYIHDAMIEQNLTEKLKLFTSITAYVTGVTDISPTERHLLRGNVSDPLQGEQLLAGALKDGETYTAGRGIHGYIQD